MRIHIDEPPHLGIVITALEVIQPGLCVVVLDVRCELILRVMFEGSMESSNSMDPIEP